MRSCTRTIQAFDIYICICTVLSWATILVWFLHVISPSVLMAVVIAIGESEQKETENNRQARCKFVKARKHSLHSDRAVYGKF